MAADAQSTVEKFVKGLVEGKLDDARRLLHDDLIVYEPGGLPFSGEYHGPQGFLDLFGKITENLDLELNPTVEYLAADDTVVMRSRMKFIARTSGNSVETGLVELYTVRDGLITELDVYYKDASAVAALLAR